MNRTQALFQVATAAGSGRTAFAPGEVRQGGLGGVDGRCRVDRPERRGDLLAVLVGHEAHRRPDQVHDTGLHGGMRPGRLDRYCGFFFF